MRLAPFVIFGVTGLVLAAPPAAKKRLPFPGGQLVERDSDAIVNAVQNVKNGADGLDAVINQVESANLTQLLAVQTAAQSLLPIISNAQADVEAAPELGIFGSLRVQISVTELISSIGHVSDDLISKKQFVDEAGVGSLVVQTLNDQKTAANSFSAALTEKIPSLLQSIASLDTSIINKDLDKAIAAYSGSSTGTSSGGGTAASSSPAAAPSAAR